MMIQVRLFCSLMAWIFANSMTDLRALAERLLASLPPEKAHFVWRKLLQFETAYGDLEAVKKLQQRRAEAFPNRNLLSHRP